MADDSTFHQCHSCQAGWSQGQGTHDCPECGLGDEEKRVIRDERLKGYEKERELKFKGGMALSGKSSRGTMILLVLLGSALVKNGDNLLRFLGHHADEVVEPAVRHEGDVVIQAGARTKFRESQRQRRDWIYQDMGELAEEMVEKNSGEVKPDSLRLDFIDSLDVEKLMFGERKK